MRRRRFIQALAAARAAPALLAQQGPQQPGQQANQPAAPAKTVPAPAPSPANDTPLRYAASDDVAAPVLRFFNAQQFAALRKAGDALVPAINGAPGALEAGAPEFLDFLISQSPADRQQLYRNGLDGLNAQARKRFNKLFADIDAGQVDTLLSPLREPWSYDPPADPVAAFLRVLKDDVRRATTNSREWNLAAAAGRTRGGGAGLYWLPID